MPTAPEPAHRSRKRTPSMRGASTLKSVSRNRSDVGRARNEGGLFKRRPRYIPPMTLNVIPHLPRYRTPGDRNTTKSLAVLPFDHHDVIDRLLEGIIVRDDEELIEVAHLTDDLRQTLTPLRVHVHRRLIEEGEANI